MITSSEIYDLIKREKLSPYEVRVFNELIADELKPYIFPYLEKKLGVDPGTPQRPKLFVCPFCGGGNKVNHTAPAKVWSENGSYLLKCFSCTHKAVDVLHLAQEQYGYGFYEAVADIINTAGASLPVVPKSYQVQQNEVRTGTAVDPEPPSAEWIRNANVYIDECSERLWKPVGKEARDYLMITRGLEERTLRTFSIGYDPACGGMVTIPTFVRLDDNADPVPMRVKQRLIHPRINPETGKEENKYRMLKGSISSCPFNDGALLHEPYVVEVEGEIEVMTIWQQGITVCDVFTFGSATNVHDPVIWRDWLKYPEYICICGDNDEAGRRSDAEKLATINQLSRIREQINRKTDADHVFMASLPDGYNDWNEFYMKGGDVRAQLEKMFTGKA